MKKRTMCVCAEFAEHLTKHDKTAAFCKPIKKKVACYWKSNFESSLSTVMLMKYVVMFGASLFS